MVGSRSHAFCPLPQCLSIQRAGLFHPPCLIIKDKKAANMKKSDVRRVTLEALEAHQYNRTRAAEALGVSLTTVKNRIRLYRKEGFIIPPSPDYVPPQAPRKHKALKPRQPKPEPPPGAISPWLLAQDCYMKSDALGAVFYLLKGISEQLSDLQVTMNELTWK